MGPDGELQVHTGLMMCAQVRQPGSGRSSAVGGDQDRGAVSVRVGDLRERQIGDRDVVSGGVGAGVARSQNCGQRLAGVVDHAVSEW